jgi:beta-lactamase class D
MLKKLCAFLMSIFALVSCSNYHATEVNKNFEKYYEQYNVYGSFVLYDLKKDQFTFYNKEQYDQAFIPASTFKIIHSLIALETGVVQDENHLLPWDSLEREVPQWNQDHDLKSAFKYSAVWYFQRVANKLGREKMQYWLDTVGYGNGDISGEIDKFWLTGDLRISPKGQLDFLKKLYHKELPFSTRSMHLVKDIMVTEEGEGYILRTKTGWSKQDGVDIGWYVGYLEKSDDVYFFVNCIQSKNPENTAFVSARKTIVDQIFQELGLL